MKLTQASDFTSQAINFIAMTELLKELVALKTQTVNGIAQMSNGRVGIMMLLHQAGGFVA